MFSCDERDEFGAWYGVHILDRKAYSLVEVKAYSLVEVCAPTAATLTPEQARFLARQIMLAADECEALRAQHITEGIVG